MTEAVSDATISTADAVNNALPHRRLAIVILIATGGLVTALVSVGYALKKIAAGIGHIRELKLYELETVLVADSLFWSPGLYIICLLAATRRNMKRSNESLALALGSLIFIDAADDLRFSSLISQSLSMAVINIVASLFLVKSIWTFTIEWPVRHWPIEIEGYNNIWRRFIAYGNWSAKSRLVIVSIASIISLPSLVEATLPHKELIYIEMLSYVGKTILCAHFVLFLVVQLFRGSRALRRQVLWVVLAGIIFLIYAAGSSLLETFGSLGLIGNIWKIDYAILDIISLALILSSLFIGAIYSNLIGTRPPIRSAAVVASFLSTLTLLMALATHYWTSQLEKSLEFSWILVLISLLGAVLIGSRIERIIGKLREFFEELIHDDDENDAASDIAA